MKTRFPQLAPIAVPVLAAAVASMLWANGVAAGQPGQQPEEQAAPFTPSEEHARALERARKMQGPREVQYTEQERSAIELALAAIDADPPLSTEDVTNLRIRSVDWPDGSLGCPQPGQEYTQAVVKGYFVSFSVDGEIKTVHVGGEAAVVCDRLGEIMAERRAQGRAVLRAHHAARIDLAAKLYVDPEEIKVTALQKETWPDSSLGCPAEGKSYEPGPVEGLRISMTCRGREYEYRTALEGEPEFVSCREIVSCHEIE